MTHMIMPPQSCIFLVIIKLKSCLHFASNQDSFWLYLHTNGKILVLFNLCRKFNAAATLTLRFIHYEMRYCRPA